MKASTERQIIRWFHMLASVPIIGLIYGPVGLIPEAVAAIRWVIFPLVVISGLWMWKGAWVKRQFGKNDKRVEQVSSRRA